MSAATIEGTETKTVKRLEDYRQSKPEQLSMFSFEDLKDHKYSNSIYLYDAIPKYCCKTPERKDGQYLDPITKHFVYKSTEYSVTIAPARIKDGDGVYRDYFPSRREELVEDALRKLACDGSCVFLNDKAGVIFSLYELQKELKRVGHGYNTNEITKSLHICQKSNMELKRESGGAKAIVSESLFLSLGISTQDDWKKHGKKAKAFVRFNSLVTKSIKKKTFRQFNYEISMSFKKALERYLYKRMSHSFIQASWEEDYSITLLTILRDSGMEEYANLRHNLYKVKEALESLKAKQIIREYLVEEIKHKRKLADTKFTIKPSRIFISEAKTANTRAIGKPKSYSENSNHISNFLSQKSKGSNLQICGN